ncbi:MAG: hypothetical protein M1818_001848 [Claussenomyces sp. TS43310]|nr:MAG: hypothetical protein M1818_001848 [Claussenomyces sp. TS43310]
MESGESEWEPAIPGSFDTPVQLRRRHEKCNPKKRERIDWADEDKPSQVATCDGEVQRSRGTWTQTLRTIFSSTCTYILNRLHSAKLRRNTTFKPPSRPTPDARARRVESKANTTTSALVRPLIETHTNQVVEIRRTDPNGNESVKRRATFEVYEPRTPFRRPRSKLVAKSSKVREKPAVQRWPSFDKGYEKDPFTSHWRGARAPQQQGLPGRQWQESLPSSVKQPLKPLRSALVTRRASNHGSPIREHTARQNQAAKQVQIKLNRENGLPREEICTFSKYARINEWIPSSLWARQQVERSNRNLDGILAELKYSDVPGTLPPKSFSPLGPFPRSIRPGVVPEYVVAPGNRFFTPPRPQNLASIYDAPEAIDTSVEMVDASPDPQLPVMANLSASRGENGGLAALEEPNYVPGSPMDLSPRHQGENAVSTIAIGPVETDLSGEEPQRPASASSRASSTDLYLGDIFLELALSGEAEESVANERRAREAREAARKAKEEAARRAAEEAAAAKLAEEAAKSKFARRMPKKKFIRPLSTEWEERIENAIQKSEHATLTTTVGGTELRGKDLLTLLGEHSWLNDEIINGYLEWIVEHANVTSARNGRNATPKAVTFNSFFYKKLASDGPQSVLRWSKRKRIDGKRLLDVDTILIPVNNASHWTLLVVCPTARTVEYLDSFGGTPTHFIKNIMEWLMAELRSDFVAQEWQILNTQSSRQFNGYDCGVFCITNAECVVNSLRTDSYGAEDMAAQRRRIAAVLLGRGFVEGLGVDGV